MAVMFLLAVSGGVAIFAGHSLWQREATFVWKAAFWVFFAIGALSGVYFGFFFHYFPSPDTHVYGFPVLHVVFAREVRPNGDVYWVDYVTPFPFLYAASNIPILSCVAATLVWCVHSVGRWITSSDVVHTGAR